MVAAGHEHLTFHRMVKSAPMKLVALIFVAVPFQIKHNLFDVILLGLFLAPWIPNAADPLEG